MPELCGIRVSKLDGPHIQNAETERKQYTVFEANHHRSLTILTHSALDCGWGWQFPRLV